LNLYALNIAFDQTWVPFIVILSEKLARPSKWIFPPLFGISDQNLMQGENQITEAQITLPSLPERVATAQLP
jgi:hypothetical protein